MQGLSKATSSGASEVLHACGPALHQKTSAQNLMAGPYKASHASADSDKRVQLKSLTMLSATPQHGQLIFKRPMLDLILTLSLSDKVYNQCSSHIMQHH
jgi:hypothetical protein